MSERGAQAAMEFRPEAAARPGQQWGDTRPAPGWGESIAAAFRTSRDDQPGHLEEEQASAWGELVYPLAERGHDPDQFIPLTRNTYFVNKQGIAAAIARERQRDPGFLPEFKGVAEFDQQWRADFQQRRARDADTVQRSGWAPWLVGSIGGGLTDPINLVTMWLGAGPGMSAARAIVADGLVNAGVELVEQPMINVERQRQGRPEMTATEMATNVGVGFAVGAAFRGALEGAEAAGNVVGPAIGAKLAPLQERFDTFARDRAMAKAFAEATPPEIRTPQQQAALDVLTREADLGAASPYRPTLAGDAEHAARLRDAERRLAAGSGTPPRGPGMLNPSVLSYLIERGYTEGQARGIAAGIHAESGGRADAVNPSSGAFGIGQWLGPRKAELFRRYGSNPNLQQQLAFLHWELQGGDHGGRSVIGSHDEADVLHRYIRDFMRPAAGAETTGDLSRGMAALGRRGESVDGIGADMPGAWDGIDVADDRPAIRPDALDADRPVVTTQGRAIAAQQIPASAIEVDAALMQFKSGGDAMGVTERLQGVQEWDPIAAGTVTVWEAADGRRLIADGHQRLGLARRMEAAGAEPVTMNAFVLREADGFSARDARIITALKNIGEGTGSAADAAKVLRDAGPAFEDMIGRRLPPKSALVRDGKALARLSDEAFGAVINEVIPEGHAAVIGHMAPDPATHMALVDLLHELDPPNRRQAESIVRQALDAGFVKETQEELFGTRNLMTGLFAQRARLLDRTLAELRKLKGAFGVAARNADALDAAGNTIDVAASEAAAVANARALALVDALALRKGNAVNELLDSAARRIADGEPIGRVTGDLVRAIRELDLSSLEREGGAAAGAGGPAGGSGRDGQPAGEDPGAEGLTPAEIDALAAEQDLGPSLFDDPDQARLFDTPDGEGVKAAAENDWHDIRAQDGAPEDPNIAAKRRQELDLAAQQPLRGDRKTGAAQDGTAPEGLFGGPAEPALYDLALFDLEDGKGLRSAADIEAEIAADKAAIEAMRQCLK